MKRYTLFAFMLVLTAALFTGCGCTSQDAQYTTLPTTMPTMATTAATTEPATRPSTQSTTQPTADRGNGPLEESTGTTGETTAPSEAAEGRTRRAEPMKS